MSKKCQIWQCLNKKCQIWQLQTKTVKFDRFIERILYIDLLTNFWGNYINLYIYNYITFMRCLTLSILYLNKNYQIWQFFKKKWQFRNFSRRISEFSTVLKQNIVKFGSFKTHVLRHENYWQTKTSLKENNAKTLSNINVFDRLVTFDVYSFIEIAKFVRTCSKDWEL